MTYLLLLACSDWELVPNTPPVTGITEDEVCVLSADPEMYDFGDSPVQELPLEASVRLLNDGGAPCQIQGLSLSEGLRFEVGALGTVLIPPGQETTFRLEYLPQTAGLDIDTVLVDSNDPESPTLEIPVQGTGLAPAIDISPAEYDFGSLYIGCDSQVELVVSNIGNMPLVVDSYQYNTSGTDLGVVVDGLPWSIEPGQAESIWVDYAPLDEYADTAYMFVGSNDPQTPSALAVQSGAGSLYGLNLDLYEQPINGSTDILFALDWSCSMYDDLANVESNFSTFVNTLASMDADYHVAAVVADSGCILGSQPYVDNSMSLSDQEDLFEVQTCFDYGGTYCPYQGSYTERAFMLLEASLSASNIKSGGCNEGMYREDASLSLIGVSDEPEQSVNPYTYYVSLFQGMKSDKDDVVMHAIGGDYPGGCGSNSAYSGFYEATVATGGLFLSICATDFGSHLESLAEQSTADLTSFELSDFPVQETILVIVDGVRVGSGWSYDASSNSVVFDEDYTPEGGSTIEIEYALYGDCDM